MNDNVVAGCLNKTLLAIVTVIYFISSSFASATQNNSVKNGLTEETAFSSPAVPTKTPLTISSLYGKFVTATGGAGNSLQQVTFGKNGGINIWMLRPGSTENTYIISTGTGSQDLCVRGTGDNKIITGKCTEGNLDWLIYPNDNGTFIIAQADRKKYLTSYPFAKQTDDNIALTDNPKDAQQWKLTLHSPKHFISKSNGMLVTISGLDIIQAPSSSDLSQEWNRQLGYAENEYRFQQIISGEESCIQGKGTKFIKDDKDEWQVIYTDEASASSGCYGPDLYWRLIPAGESSTYYIQSDRGLNLTAPDNAKNSRLIVSAPSTSDTQKWTIEDVR